MAVQAKAKKRMREEEQQRMREAAILKFQEWKKQHPMATTQEGFDAFDMILDSMELVSANS